MNLLTFFERAQDSSRMRWFRSNRLFGGCLALFALVLQFAVAFAHIHPEDFKSSIDIGFVNQASVPQLSTEVAGSPTTPSDHRGNGQPHDNCVICASISLAGNALIGQPPLLSAPTAVNTVFLPPISEFDFELVRYFSIRTRAPPVV
jgi:hypothetical protein